MVECRFERHGRRFKCVTCQAVRDSPRKRRCDGAGKRKAPKTPGLGDRVAGFLKGLGVTPRRWKRLKHRLGLKPTCGCHKRQRWLNEWRTLVAAAPPREVD